MQVKQLKKVIRTQAERLCLQGVAPISQNPLSSLDDDEVVQITRSEFELKFGGLKRKLLFEDCESGECSKPKFIPDDEDDAETPRAHTFKYYGDGGVLEFS